MAQLKFGTYYAEDELKTEIDWDTICFEPKRSAKWLMIYFIDMVEGEYLQSVGRKYVASESLLGVWLLC